MHIGCIVRNKTSIWIYCLAPLTCMCASRGMLQLWKWQNMQSTSRGLIPLRCHINHCHWIYVFVQYAFDMSVEMWKNRFNLFDCDPSVQRFFCDIFAIFFMLHASVSWKSFENVHFYINLWKIDLYTTHILDIYTISQAAKISLLVFVHNGTR